MKNFLRVKGLSLVALGALCWGISGTAVQYLFQNQRFTAEWLVVIRMIISGILLILWGAVRGDKNILRVWRSKKSAVKLILFSVAGMLGVQYTYFAAISHGNAATATILQYLSPVIITIYLAICNKKIPERKQIICICMAMLGTFLIITKGNINSLSISKMAVFWGIASAFTSAVYTLQPVSLLKEYGSSAVVGWGMFIGGTIFSFIYSPFKCTGNWCIESVTSIAFVVIFGTLIGFTCYLSSLKYIEPSEASVLGCIEPLSAAIISILFLGVNFTLIQWIGSTCIIITISILSLDK